jgi:dolichyl-phosphate beta-glucosyltransferase
MRYSVVIPAYNEGFRIPRTLAAVTAAFAPGETVEVLVADDGSLDDTADRAQAAAAADGRIRVIRGDRNRGKGAAVRSGVLASQGDLVLVTDADLSAPMSELPRLEEAIRQGFHVAIGSRGTKGATLVRRQPLVREAAGRMGNLMIRLACPSLWDLADTQCGFKLFQGEAARKLFAMQTLDRYGFDVEILHLARTRGYRVAEIPVAWAHQEGSKVKPSDYWVTLWEVLVVRLNELRGKYGD